MVHVDDPMAEFGIYQHPKLVTDDVDDFPNVSRVPNSMLRKVNPIDLVLLPYLQTINPSTVTKVLLENFVGTSNRTRGSKKSTKASPSKPDPSPKNIVK